MSAAAASDLRPQKRRWPRRLRILRTRQGSVGVALLLVVLGVAFIGPLFAGSTTATLALPGQPPGNGMPLGADALGRDVLNRVLSGGSSVIILTVVSVGLTYAIGILFGIVAGMNPARADGILMRFVDLALVFPPLLLLLLLIVGAGEGFWVLVIGITLVLFPGVARIVRAATLEVGTSGYVEAAHVRGESMSAIMRRDVLPNISAPILADFGVRFSYAIVLAASVNFLGLGDRPPASNWGLMVSENRSVISTNIWAVVAPAAMLALLAVSVNLIGDAYARGLGRSEGRQ